MQKGGGTYADHLKALAPRSEWARRELAGPELPQDLAYLWSWFCELGERRQHAWRDELPPVPLPIPWSEIRSWAVLTRRRPSSREVDVLRALDRAWMAPPQREDAHGGEGQT